MPVIKSYEKELLASLIGLSDFGMYTMQPGESGDRHYHDFDEIWYIVAGRATVLHGNDELELVAGDAFFTPAGVEHQIRRVQEPFTVVFTSGALRGHQRSGHLHRDTNGQPHSIDR